MSEEGIDLIDHHVVMCSSGTASAMTGKLLVERVGAERVTLLFADVNGEDADNYRFLYEAWRWIDAPLVVLDNGGRTIWDVFKQQRFLGNDRVDLCSRVLKREVMRKWLEENHDPTSTAVHLGYDVDEGHRVAKAEPHWVPWRVEAPMTWGEGMFKHEGWERLAAAGIELPALTRDGYAHANCGGMCVRMGHAQAKMTLDRRPDVYAQWEVNEQGMRDFLGADVAIMTDRRKAALAPGQTRRPLTLREFRHRVQAGEGVDPNDWGSCNCIGSWEDTLTELEPGSVDTNSITGKRRVAAYLKARFETPVSIRTR